MALGFFAWKAARNFGDIPPLRSGPFSWIALLASLVLATASVGVTGTIWLLLLRDRGCAVSRRKILAIYGVAQFGKYLPGNVGHHVARAFLGQSAGIPVRMTICALLLENLWAAATGMTVAMLGMAIYLPDQHAMANPAILSCAALFLLGAPWIGIAVLNRLPPRWTRLATGGEPVTTPRFSTAAWVTALFVLCFMIMGAIMKLQAAWLLGIGEGTFWQFTCLLSVAWLAGFLTPGAPGGLGVRESMILLLFGPILGTGAAAGLAVTLRVSTSLGDLFGFLAGAAMRKGQSPAGKI